MGFSFGVSFCFWLFVLFVEGNTFPSLKRIVTKWFYEIDIFDNCYYFSPTFTESIFLQWVKSYILFCWLLYGNKIPSYFYFDYCLFNIMSKEKTYFHCVDKNSEDYEDVLKIDVDVIFNSTKWKRQLAVNRLKIKKKSKNTDDTFHCPQKSVLRDNNKRKKKRIKDGGRKSSDKTEKTE